MTPAIERARPPYVQVAAHIRDQIVRGDLKPGDSVPSVREIAESWGIARATAEKALATLKIEGLVSGTPGVGTVVVGAPVYQAVRDRYANVSKTGLIYPPGQHAKIVMAGLTRAPKDVANALQVPAGALVVRRHRVTYDAGERPIASSTSWFAAELATEAPRLLETGRIRQGTTRYVEEVTGRVLRYAEDQIYARLATVEEAAEMSQTMPAAVLVTEHTAWDTADQPFTYEVGLAPAGFRRTTGYEPRAEEGRTA